MFLGTIFLVVYKRFFDRKNHPIRKSREADAWRVLAKRIALIAVPVTITSSALYLAQFLDTLVINRALMGSGVPLQTAEQLYSAYTTYAVPAGRPAAFDARLSDCHQHPSYCFGGVGGQAL